MGLDVYLYRCPDRQFAKAQEEEYERESEAVSESMSARLLPPGESWSKRFDSLPEDRQKAYWAERSELLAPIQARLGMDDDSCQHASVEQIELPSKLHPDHYFRIGYFRSSYNGGGFNSYARRLGIPTLNDIMGADDECEFTPDWRASRERAQTALQQLRAKDFGFDVDCIRPNPFLEQEIGSENAALETFRKEQERWAGRENGFESYMNGNGTFWTKGQQIYAAIPGTTEFLSRKIPCVYLIYKREGENWYAQALEVVIETCDWVLEQPNVEQFYLHWSG